MKILIITQWYPPYNSSGVQRWARITEELSKNHQITVLTCYSNLTSLSQSQPAWLDRVSVLRVIVPEKVEDYFGGFGKRIIGKLRKLYLKFSGINEHTPVSHAYGEFPENSPIPVVPKLSFKSFLLYLYQYSPFCPSWMISRPLIAVAKKDLRGAKFDAIIASTPGFGCLVAAKKLSKHFQIPWYADYRDLWAADLPPNTLLMRLCGSFGKAQEKSVIKNAKKVFVVSEEMRKYLPCNHLKVVELPTPIAEISEEILVEPAISDSATLRISYGGSVPVNSSMLLFLKALEDILCLNPLDIELTLYGHRNVIGWLVDQIPFYPNVAKITCYLGELSHHDSIRIQKSSDLLLLLGYNGYTQDTILTGKLFEYLAVRKKILLYDSFEKSARERYLQKYKAGVKVANMISLRKVLHDEIANKSNPLGSEASANVELLQELHVVSVTVLLVKNLNID
jgi:hypothetical protein